MRLWLRITLVVTTLTALTALTISAVVNQQFKSNLNLAHHEWSHILSKSISQSVMEYTIEGNVRKTQEILRRIIKESNEIEYIIIVDFNNKLFASTLDVSKLPESLRSIDHTKCKSIKTKKDGEIHVDNYNVNKVVMSAFGENVLDYTHPFIENLEAHIHIGFRNSMLNKSLFAIKQYSTLIAILISSIGFIVAFFLAKKISRPLEELSEAVTVFGKTGQYNKQMVTTSDKDILKLNANFKNMFNERIQYESEITGYKENLESLVEERTKRLEMEIYKHEQTEKDLLKEKEISDKANRTKSDFLSHMSHELRTPLNAILGFAQLLDLNESDSVKESSSEILHAGYHLLSLINDILDLSKIEAGKLALSIEAVNINEVIDECYSLLQGLIEEKDINVKLNYDHNKKFIISVDRVRLKQSILNIFSNAVKYNEKSGSIIISFEFNNEFLRIAVKDTGKGIPDKKQHKLFSPFQRLDMEKSGVDGVGIGLVITKALVESMKGSIGFKSEYGIGSVFWIEFPLVSVEEIEIESESIDKDIIAIGNKKNKKLFAFSGIKKILYIEDNPSNLKMVRNILKAYSNIEFYPAISPSEAFALLKQTIPDLILLDINLPEMDGYEVKEILDSTTEYKNIKVVGLSANAMQHDIDKAKDSGFIDYLPKPINLKNFLDVIESVLAD